MRKILGALVVVLLAASCGGDVTEVVPNGNDEQVIRSIGPALCERLRTCLGAAYAQAYPSGTPACVEQVVASEGPSKLSQVSHCSDAEAQSCSVDTQSFACAPFIQGQLPASCMKCSDESPQTGPNGTAVQVLRAIAFGICSRIRGCAMPESFMQKYPGGVAGCVATILSALPPSQANLESVCNDVDVKTCRTDLKALACPAALQGTYPSSCTKC